MTIPNEITHILKQLKSAGFEAFIVGGCVRDFLLKREPKDWDITTSASPEQIQKVFPKNFLNNDFGTVTVINESQSPAFSHIEITPFRSESGYSDKRHPDKVAWAKSINDDLSRRDFTINAIAMDIDGQIIDPFEGQKDLKHKEIKAVGEPNQRFNEDALRLMRAARFASVLGFNIEKETLESIKKNADLIKYVSRERVRDELIKLISGDFAVKGIELMRETSLLNHILPELMSGYGVSQNKHHIYDCYEHAVKSLEFAVKSRFNWYVRLSALLHDIGKPATKRGQGKDATFYGHEVVGGRMAARIMERLKFSKKEAEKVVSLVRYHLFYYNAGEVTESSVRRLIRNVGTQNVEDLLLVRQADRIGSGCPKAEPYKLRHLRYIIDKVSQDPISPKMLKLNGNDLMQLLGVAPGPKIGQILDVLLERVIDDPALNDQEILSKMAKELAAMPEKELLSMRAQANKGIDSANEQADKSIKKKHRV